MLDYYFILNLDQNASDKDICDSYINLVLQYHPQRTKNQSVKDYQQFCYISEAFEVLYNPLLKSIYDQKGYFGLKMRQNDQKIIYEFMGNPEEIFDKFFGNKDYYQVLVQFDKDFNNYLKSKNQIEAINPSDIVVELPLTLLEIYQGVIRTIEFERDVLQPDGIHVQTIQLQREIKVPQGCPNDNVLVFKNEGNQKSGYQNSKIKR